MTPLYRNDAPGRHAPSLYAEGLPKTPERPVLKGHVQADCVVVGAGLTGLWAALTLARAGRKVVVLDAHRVGFGASGRNGGQVHAGYNRPQSWLEARLGRERARALWDLSDNAISQLRAFCRAAAPDAAFKPGLAHGEYAASDLDAAHREAEHLSQHYDYNIKFLEKSAFTDLVKSPQYVGGVIDPNGGHLDPMAYVRAVAREAEASGAIIHELSAVTALNSGPSVRAITNDGEVTASHAILAGNGYLPPLKSKVSSRVLPINSFIAATEPLPERWTEVLAEDIAVSDSRFVVNYYRFSPDKRFLFGGRESYSLGFPSDIATALTRRMESLFPQLRGVAAPYVWGGTLGITPTRLPYIARVSPRVLSGSGFSGHGVALAGMAGRVMADAVLGQEDGLTNFEALPVPPFPGGRTFRAPILTLAMTWFALRDRLGF